MCQRLGQSWLLSRAALALFVAATGDALALPEAALAQAVPRRAAPRRAAPQQTGMLDQFDATLAGTRRGKSDERAAPQSATEGGAGALPAVLSESAVVERLEGASTHPQVRRAQQLRRQPSGTALQRPFVVPTQAAQAARRAAVQATAEYRRYHALGTALGTRAAPGAGQAPSATTSSRGKPPVGGGALGMAFGEAKPTGAALSRRKTEAPTAGGGVAIGVDACLTVARLRRALDASPIARAEAGEGPSPPSPRPGRDPGHAEPSSVPNRLAAELTEPPAAGRGAAGRGAPSCVAEARALRTEALELQAIFGPLSGWPAFETEVLAPLLATHGPIRPPPGRIRYLGH